MADEIKDTPFEVFAFNPEEFRQPDGTIKIKAGQEFNLGEPLAVIQPDDPQYAELKARHEKNLEIAERGKEEMR